MKCRYPQPVLPLLLRLPKTLHFLLFLFLDLQYLCMFHLCHLTQHLMHHGPALLGTVSAYVSLLVASEAEALRLGLAEVHGLPLSAECGAGAGFDRGRGNRNEWASLPHWMSLKSTLIVPFPVGRFYLDGLRLHDCIVIHGHSSVEQSI